MALSIFLILESALLLANAVAILNDRFLKACKFYLFFICQGVSM